MGKAYSLDRTYDKMRSRARTSAPPVRHRSSVSRDGWRPSGYRTHRFRNFHSCSRRCGAGLMRMYGRVWTADGDLELCSEPSGSDSVYRRVFHHGHLGLNPRNILHQPGGYVGPHTDGQLRRNPMSATCSPSSRRNWQRPLWRQPCFGGGCQAGPISRPASGV